MSARNAQRGQVLPLWIVAILTTFVLMFLAVNYGNTVRWQMRAQNAADGASQALMAIQTQRWNELTVALYTANIEEYRIRMLLDGMLNALNGAGGCSGAPGTPKTGSETFTTGTGSCDQTFNTLLPAYVRAVNRYTTLVAQVNNISSEATYANWQSDMKSLLAHISSSTHCNNVGAATINADGGDCQFTYTLNGSSLRTGLNPVAQDAYISWVPDSEGGYLSPGQPVENSALFDPGQVDVVVCAKVPPLIPGFGPLHALPHYVIGRGGATSAQVEEDWMQPGQLNDPVRTSAKPLFQPQETYVSTDSALGYDWYGVLFSGNTWAIGEYTDPKTGLPDYEYFSTVNGNEMSNFTAFWSAVPFNPNLVDSNNSITPSGTGPGGAPYCP